MRRVPGSPRLHLLLAGAVLLGAGALAVSRPAASPAVAWQPAPAVAAPVPLPFPTVSTPPPVPAAILPPDLQLRGVLGYRGAAGAAIFARAGGRQSLVPVGHEVAPGVSLDAIALDHVTLRYGGQRVDLPLSQPGAETAPLPTQTAGTVEVNPSRDLANFRLGLKPEGDPVRPRGYRVRGDVPLPMLDHAGLQAGDLVLAVNGQPLDRERLLDLPSEMHAATRVEIDYERAGKRFHTVVPTR